MAPRSRKMICRIYSVGRNSRKTFRNLLCSTLRVMEESNQNKQRMLTCTQPMLVAVLLVTL